MVCVCVCVCVWIIVTQLVCCGSYWETYRGILHVLESPYRKSNSASNDYHTMLVHTREGWSWHYQSSQVNFYLPYDVVFNGCKFIPLPAKDKLTITTTKLILKVNCWNYLNCYNIRCPKIESSDRFTNFGCLAHWFQCWCFRLGIATENV